MYAHPHSNKTDNIKIMVKMLKLKSVLPSQKVVKGTKSDPKHSCLSFYPFLTNLPLAVDSFPCPILSNIKPVKTRND